jgi:hypothetical protein
MEREERGTMGQEKEKEKLIEEKEKKLEEGNKRALLRRKEIVRWWRT